MFTVAEKIAEIDRELAQRRKVYPRWVQLGKIGKHAAERQVAILTEIRADYARQAATMDPRESGVLL